MPSGKDTIIFLNSWIDKKRYCYKNWVIFALPHTEFELDLANYATKSYLITVAGVDTSDFAKKADLVSLKSDIDKLHKLEKVPSVISSLKRKLDKLDIDKLDIDKLDIDKLQFWLDYSFDWITV